MSKSTKTSPFPVFNQQLTSGRISFSESMKFIDMQSAADLYFSTMETRSDLRLGDLGPIVSPYPEMWMEAEDTHYATESEYLKLAVRISQVEERGVKTHACEVFIMTQDRSVVESPYTYFIDVDASGSFLKSRRGISPHDQAEFTKTFGPNSLEAIDLLAFSFMGAAAFAISLMNCRNVAAPVQTHQPRAKRGQQQRKGVSYHVIKLPGKNGNGGGGALTGTQRQHTARGHFKTYTADAPLMGRHVGTYYWGWQVRGNKKNGEIISSYAVGAA